MANDDDSRWSDDDLGSDIMEKMFNSKRKRNITNTITSDTKVQQKPSKSQSDKNTENIEVTTIGDQKSDQDTISESNIGELSSTKVNLNNKEKQKTYHGQTSETISKSDIQEVIYFLKQIASGIAELRGKSAYIYDEKGRDTTRRGRAFIYKYLNYYDVKNTINKAGPEDPQDFDSPVYNIERVFEVLERYSDIIHVINGGTESLFCTVSHEGKTNFSKESVIFPGEVKDFYNVYELRLRSPEVGLPYRVTEYLIQSVSQTSLIPIELANIHDEPLPSTGEDWLGTDITPLISPTTFRIEVAVSKAGIFSAAVTKDGDTQVVDFNVTSGPALIADGVYVFELLVHNGDSVNFRYSVDGGTIRILRIQEIDASAA